MYNRESWSVTAQPGVGHSSLLHNVEQLLLLAMHWPRSVAGYIATCTVDDSTGNSSRYTCHAAWVEAWLTQPQLLFHPL